MPLSLADRPKLLLVEETPGAAEDVAGRLTMGRAIDVEVVAHAQVRERLSGGEASPTGIAVVTGAGGPRATARTLRMLRAAAGSVTLIVVFEGDEAARSELLDAGANRILDRNLLEPDQIVGALGHSPASAVALLRDVVESPRALLGLLQEVAVAARLATSSEAALHKAIVAICRSMGWPIGHVWRPIENDSNAQRLESAGVWFIADEECYAPFRDRTEALTYGPGQGLAGAALAARAPVWRADPSPRRGTRGAIAEELGLRWGLAVPVRAGDTTVAVIEFFSPSPRDPSSGLIDVMRYVAVQLGLTMESIEVADARKRAEDAANASEVRYRRVVDHMSEALAIDDVDGNIVFANDAFCRLFRLSPEEVRRKTVWDLVAPQEYARLRALHERRLKGDASAVSDYEIQVVRSDGARLWVELSVQALEEDGRQVGTQSVIRDITDRKAAERALRESEREYRGLFENAHDAIFIFRPKGEVILEVNRAASEVYGYSREEFLAGTMELMSLDVAVGRSQVRAALRADGAFCFETVQRAKDGTLLNIDITAIEIEYRGAPAILSLNRDISRRKQLERQFLQSQRMEAMGRLAGGIAHDFNNVITAILTLSELAGLQVEQGSTVARELEDIHHAARHAAGLTRQLLTFSRQRVVRPEDVVVDELLAGLQTMLPRLVSENVALAFALQAKGRTVCIDVGQLEQVLINLVVNARDAIVATGHIGVSTRVVHFEEPQKFTSGQLTAGDYIRVQVRDDGTGIDPQVQSHIFEPFFTTKHKSEGTGLGLSTVFGIVTQASGQIDVTSQPGSGTSLDVYLPLTGDAPESARDRAAPGGLRSAVDETILLVEDDERVRLAAAEVLERCGYRVWTARSGLEAWRRIRKHASQIDLVITDVVMPGMQGTDLVRRARAAYPDLRFLLTSGYIADEAHRESVAGQEFLEKPFTSQTLADKARAVLDG